MQDFRIINAMNKVLFICGVLIQMCRAAQSGPVKFFFRLIQAHSTGKTLPRPGTRCTIYQSNTDCGTNAMTLWTCQLTNHGTELALMA